jgi:hypothetical protein
MARRHHDNPPPHLHDLVVACARLVTGRPDWLDTTKPGGVRSTAPALRKAATKAAPPDAQQLAGLFAGTDAQERRERRSWRGATGTDLEYSGKNHKGVHRAS